LKRRKIRTDEVIGDERMDSDCGASNSALQGSGNTSPQGAEGVGDAKEALTEAESRPFAILSLLDQLRSLNSPHLPELTQLEEGLRW